MKKIQLEIENQRATCSNNKRRHCERVDDSIYRRANITPAKWRDTNILARYRRFDQSINRRNLHSAPTNMDGGA